MNSFEFKKWASYYLLILAGIVSYVAINNFEIIGGWFNRLFGYLSPFLAGIVIAYLLDIPSSKIEKWLEKSKNRFLSAKARGIGVFITYMIFIISLVVLLRIILPEIIRSIAEFIANFQSYFENTRSYLVSLIENDGIFSQIDVNAITKYVTESVREAVKIESVWKSFLGLLSVSTFVLNIVIAFISSIYLLLEAKTIKAFFSKLLKVFISEKNVGFFMKYFNSTNAYFKQYLYCLLVDGFVVGFASVIGLYFIGTKYAFVLGVLEGVTNLIPYFGAIVGSVMVVVIVLFTDGLGKAVAVAVFLLALQQVDGNIIKPKLFGDSFNISPFVVILSITIGGSYYGVTGMVIAIPVVAVLNNVINDILDYRIAKKKEGNAENVETENNNTEWI